MQFPLALIVMVFCVSRPFVSSFRRRTTIIYTNTSATSALHTLHLEGTIRLVGGEVPWEGNVEIYHNGRWGSVCDDEWDESEGLVVCRSLGYEGVHRVTSSGFFGPGRPIIWMDDVFCTGKEAFLSSCPFAGWKVHDCEKNEVAGVVCRIHYPSGTGGRRRSAARMDDHDDRNDGGSTFQLSHLLESSTRRTITTNVTEEERRHFDANLPVNSDRDLQVPSSPSWLNLPSFPRRRETVLHAMSSPDQRSPLQVERILLTEGRNPFEGSVQVKTSLGSWIPVCGDGWSLPSAMVVCREYLPGSYAQEALENSFPFPDTEYEGRPTSLFARITCKGQERSLSECRVNILSPSDHHTCHAVAGVICTYDLPDLMPDERELESSFYLEDKNMMLLHCAAEENCLSSSVASVDRSNYGWLLEGRRLLRFTAKIGNYGTADFRPNLSKTSWIWHSCHRHFHSMEVFAHFDVLRPVDGRRMAEGHKASFCLEDNDCDPGILPKYKCADFGDQGISVGCKDIYLNNIDCQWIDITDLPSDQYIFKMTVNPEMKVAELTFDNNSVLCNLLYDLVSIRVSNCTIGPL